MHPLVQPLSSFRIIPELSKSNEVLDALEDSAATVTQIIAEAALAGNQSMYGTTTGFGGSGK